MNVIHGVGFRSIICRIASKDLEEVLISFKAETIFVLSALPDVISERG